MRYFTVRIANSAVQWMHPTSGIFLTYSAAEAFTLSIPLHPDDVKKNQKREGINRDYIQDYYPDGVPFGFVPPYPLARWEIEERDELWFQNQLWDRGEETRVNRWSDERWYTRYFEVHGLHQTEADPKSCTFWDGRRWVSMKPGKYLKKFCNEILTPRQIEFQSNIWTGRPEGESPWPSIVKFARSVEEVQWVYDNGPQSCMKGMPGVIAYADSDLAVAYMYDEDEDWVIARAICWPDKKVFGRVYPNQSDYHYANDGFASKSELQEARRHFTEMLRKDGWTSTEEAGSSVFEGARMPMLGLPSQPNSYALPYPDHLGVYIDEEAGQFVMAAAAPPGKTLLLGTTESVITLRQTTDYFSGKKYYSNRYKPEIIAPDGSKVDVINHDDRRVLRDPFSGLTYIRHKDLKTVNVVYSRLYSWSDRKQQEAEAVLPLNGTSDRYWQDWKGRYFQSYYDNPVKVDGKLYHPLDPQLLVAQGATKQPPKKKKVSPSAEAWADMVKGGNTVRGCDCNLCQEYRQATIRRLNFEGIRAPTGVTINAAGDPEVTVAVNSDLTEVRRRFQAQRYDYQGYFNGGVISPRMQYAGR